VPDPDARLRRLAFFVQVRMREKDRLVEAVREDAIAERKLRAEKTLLLHAALHELAKQLGEDDPQVFARRWIDEKVTKWGRDGALPRRNGG
jgi:hypothetical protein